MENRNASAEILNDLVQIHNDRVVGYETAMKELKDEDQGLKMLFVKMIGESQRLKMALATEVEVAGLLPEKGTTNSGKIYRVWMDVKAIFTGKDRKTILNNCEFGEDAAQNAYKMALESGDLSEFHRRIVKEQQAVLKVSHDEVKALRDAQP